jgi:hypothetical protein
LSPSLLSYCTRNRCANPQTTTAFTGNWPGRGGRDRDGDRDRNDDKDDNDKDGWGDLWDDIWDWADDHDDNDSDSDGWRDEWDQWTRTWTGGAYTVTGWYVKFVLFIALQGCLGSRACSRDGHLAPSRKAPDILIRE